VEKLLKADRASKPIIISIAASEPSELRKMLEEIQALRKKLLDNLGKARIAVEFNTSCPNIANSAPLGYLPEKTLLPLILTLAEAFMNDHTLTIGCKMPPYVYQGQFTDFLDLLSSLVTEIGSEKRCPISFLTCTNTLGNSLLFSSQTAPSQECISLENRQFAVPTPLGGLAGEGIHAIALGNVFTFRQLINSRTWIDKGLGELKIIGVGGVTSKSSAERMRKAGADVVACATLLGKEGVRAFEILGK
jgi:dihydroorotate dehydrogenase (fumarate)